MPCRNYEYSPLAGEVADISSRRHNKTTRRRVNSLTGPVADNDVKSSKSRLLKSASFIERVDHCSRRADFTPRTLLQQLHWLPIKHRIDFKIANSTFRTLHFSQPADLRSSLHACHSTCSLRLSNTNLLSAPFVGISFGSCSFSVAAHKIWNSLPLSLRACTSPDTFRRHLKTHYCQQAFQST